MNENDRLRGEFAREFKRFIDTLNGGGLTTPTTAARAREARST